MRGAKQASGQIDFYINSLEASGDSALEATLPEARSKEASTADELPLIIEVQPGIVSRSLLDIAVENSVEISHSCGGMGSCGTCRVYLEWEPSQGGPNPPTEIEEEMRQDRGFIASERLACQIVWGEAFDPLQVSPRWRVRVPTK